MPNEREFTYRIAFEGDSGNFEAVLSSMKSSAQKTFDDIKALGAKVDLFPKLEGQVSAASDALQKARADVAAFVDQIAAAKAAGSPTAELEKGLKSAQQQLVQTSREFNNSVTALSKLENQLTRAGVDTRNLANEQQRLAAAQRDAAAAAELEAAKQTLGVKTLADVTPRINDLRTAFTSLQNSGKLSANELAAAQAVLRQRIAAVRGEVTGLGGDVKVADSQFASFASTAITRFALPLATLATLASAVREVVAAGKEYTNRLAEISTVTNLTQKDLADLGSGARQVATELGLDLNETLKGVFELLRSGVPKDNVIEVLRAAAVAARASFGELGDGVKIADSLITVFGADAKDLPALFDKIIRGSHEGGATFKEFADNATPLLNVARAAGISFDDLVAVLTVFVDNEKDAGRAVSDLTKIIAKLETSEARNRLRELGVTSDTLAGKMQQLGSRSGALEELLGDGLAGAGTKGANALATISNRAGDFVPKLESIGKAAGDGAKGVQIFLDSPEGRSDRFNAAVRDASTNLSLLYGSGSRLAQGGTAVLEFFNRFRVTLNSSTTAGTIYDNVVSRFVADLFGVKTPAAEAAAGVKAVGDASQQSAALIEAARIATKRASDDLKQFGVELITQAKALTDAAAGALTDIQGRAAAQIAALDRSRDAEAATAQATIAIQLKSAQDRLAIISKNEADVNAAVNTGIAAREKLQQDTIAKANLADEDRAKAEKKLAAESAAARIAALGPVLAQYQAFYNEQIGLAQAAFAKEQSITQARVDINRTVAEQIRQIQASLLGAFDQYLDKQKHIDELVSQGRAKAIAGDIAKAKEFFDQAIQESNGLAKVIDENGNVIVTDLQARTDRLNALKGIAKAVNDTFGDQAAAAKKGGEGFRDEADKVKEKILELQNQYDEFKKTVADGLKARIDVDQDSVNKAFATLNDLTKDRTVKVTVDFQTAGGAPVPQEFSGPPAPSGGATGSFARGGHVPRNVQGFALGGAAFNAPTWAKVPGAGNADTVPAALQAGSFVVRKSAVARYGDDTMRQFARGFATGGSVLYTTPTNDREKINIARGFAFGGDVATAHPPLFAFGLGAKSQTKAPVYASDLPSGSTSLGPEIPAAELPSDPKQKKQAILKYAFEVPAAAIQIDGYFYWKSWLQQLDAAQKLYSIAPSDANLDAILRTARVIGLNIGVTNRNGLGLQGFDVDGRRFHRTPGTASFAPPGLAGIGNTFDFYARGGRAGTDTVPAYLTPGEYVIKPAAVESISRRFGGGFLDAVNQSRVAPEAIAHLMNPAPPPMPRYFAEGGRVNYAGDVNVSTSNVTQGSARGGDTYHLHFQGFDKTDDWVDRVLIPKLEQKQRRSGKQ